MAVGHLDGRGEIREGLAKVELQQDRV